jgi:hypothetical protein
MARAKAQQQDQEPEVAPGVVRYLPPGPVGKAFIKSDAFVAAIRGPIGSGKSTCCVMKLIRNVQKQKRLKDGWIRRRTAVIRNTYSELRTTTIKTWHQWIPPSMGSYRDTAPPTHHVVDQANKLDWEVIFIALDRPDDVRKLLSLELSDAWINEAREVPKAILEGLTGRVGRFPRHAEGGCTDPQILMDTNPPDTDHWWYRMAEDPSPEDVELNAELEQKLRELGALRQDQKLYEWFTQPGGEAPNAENTGNLPPGYYLKAKANKAQEWIKVYIDGAYGFVMDGKPVYPDFRDNVHCKPFELSPRLPLHIGLDFGLTPAAAFGQQMPNGQWRFRSEVVTERAGIIRFAGLIKDHLAERYPDFKLARVTGDPSGNQAQGGDENERTVFQLLAANGVIAHPAHSNDPTLRREAFSKPMRTLIDGEPGMLIHPDCKVWRKGLAGGFCYRRIQVSGEARYRDTPDKNHFSHICEAGEYLMMGAGEGRAIVKPEITQARPAFAISDYSIFGDD